MARELEAWMRDHESDVDPASDEAIQGFRDLNERLRALGYTR